MSKRILLFGALAALVITTLLVNLSLLDIVNGTELRSTLGRTLAVIGVSTAALVAIAAILKAGRTRLPAEAGSHKSK